MNLGIEKKSYEFGSRKKIMNLGLEKGKKKVMNLGLKKKVMNLGLEKKKVMNLGLEKKKKSYEFGFSEKFNL